MTFRKYNSFFALISLGFPTAAFAQTGWGSYSSPPTPTPASSLVGALPPSFSYGIPNAIIDVHGTGRYLKFDGAGTPGDTVFGAKNLLAYSVSPIVLAGINAKLTIPDREGWEYFGLKSSYETSRFYQNGGSISSNSNLARQLGLRGTAADIVSGTLSFLHVGFDAEYASFTRGRVQIQDVATKIPFDDAPFQFHRVRAELFFDLSPYLFSIKDADASVYASARNKLTIQADYYNTTIPRIIYLTENRTPPGAVASAGNSVVVTETAPQPVNVSMYTLGATYRLSFLRGIWGQWSASLTALLGYSQLSFFLPTDLGAPDSASNRQTWTVYGPAFVGRIGTDFDIIISDHSTWFLSIGGTIFYETYYASGHINGDHGGDVETLDGYVSMNGKFSFHYSLLATAERDLKMKAVSICSHCLWIGTLPIFLFFFTRPLNARESAAFSPEPMPSERLSTPVTLPDCSGFQIVEWKASVFAKRLTGRSKEGIDFLNTLCKRTTDAYPVFIKSKFSDTVGASFTVSASLLPADIKRDGASHRNLNDIRFRFSKIWRECCYWGFYVHSRGFLFMRNDPLIEIDKPNMDFAETFHHELFHILLKQTGMKIKWLHDSDMKDEETAREFVSSLGLRPRAR